MLDDSQLGEMLYSVERGMTSRVDVTKVGRGAFNTKSDSWLNSAVRTFIEETGLTSAVDPFAGQGDLLKVCAQEFTMATSGFDIQEHLGWPVNDSLKSITNHHGSLCITNPPYLAKYSARRKSMWPMVGEYYEKSNRNDLYEIALDRCLQAFDYIIAILPETFLHSSYPKDRCTLIAVLEENPFEDTTFPVCVTCWGPKKSSDSLLFLNDEKVMSYAEMIRLKGKVSRNSRVLFNVPNGHIGLRAVDGINEGDRICFSHGDEFDYPRTRIKVSSRLMTYLSIPELRTRQEIDSFCLRANGLLESYRTNSMDIILSGFKGNNKNGKRRRRLDYRLARKIILEALAQQQDV